MFVAGMVAAQQNNRHLCRRCASGDVSIRLSVEEQMRRHFVRRKPYVSICNDENVMREMCVCSEAASSEGRNFTVLLCGESARP